MKNIYYDIEITAKSMIKYEKGYFSGKRTGKIKIYDRKLITNKTIHRTLSQLHFSYKNKKVRLAFLKDDLDKIEAILSENQKNEDLKDQNRVLKDDKSFNETLYYLACENCGGYYKIQDNMSYDICNCGGKLKRFDSFIEYLEYLGAKRPYVYCNKCGNYSELEKNDPPEKNKKCECGGKLVFVNSSKKSLPKLNDEHSLYISSVYADVTISHKSIIVYKKSTWNAKRTGEINQYKLDQIKKIKIKQVLLGYKLGFKYYGKKVSIKIAELDTNPSLNKIIEFFEELSIPIINYMLGHYAMCPDIDCPNINYLKIGANCPDCGKLAIQGDAMDKSNNVNLKMEKNKVSTNMAKKKEKYGFIKAAQGVNGRVELYDKRIRLPGKQDFLFEDIISVDFKEAGQGLSGLGYIEFHIRGMTSQSGSMLMVGGSGINVGLYGNNGQKTFVKFKKLWENDFIEIKNIVEKKIR